MTSNANRLSSFPIFHSNKATLVLVCILVVILIVDTSIIKIYYFSFNDTPLSWRIILFIVISSFYLVSLYLILQFVKQKSEHIRARGIAYFTVLHKIVIISQCLLILDILLVNFQIILTSVYSSVLLIVATWISYFTAIVMLGVLAQKFISWFRSDRNYIVMLYAVSSSMLAVNAAFIVSLVTVSLMNVPAYIQPSITFGTPFSSLGLTTMIINYGYIISSIVSFTLWWIATVMILRTYRKKSGKVSWLALGLPLVYFLIHQSHKGI